MGAAEVMAMIRANAAKGFTGRASDPVDTTFRPTRLENVKRIETPVVDVEPDDLVQFSDGEQTLTAEVLPPEADTPPDVHTTATDPALALSNAHADGYAEGLAAGLEQGRAEGRAEALAEFDTDADAEIGPARDAFVAAVRKLALIDPQDTRDLAQALTAAVRKMAQARAGQAIDDLPAAFLTRIETLAERVSQGLRSVSLRLNPDDLAAITPHLPQSDALAGATITADARLGRGDIDLRAEGIRLTDILSDGGTV